MNRWLWREEAGLYGYFVHGAGSGALRGTVDPHQEAAGLAFAVLAGVPDQARADRILTATHRQPRGVVNVWPHFPERYSDHRPGRHNAMCWPMVMGLFGAAGAVAGRVDIVAECLDGIGRLASGSGNRFEEVYDAVTGAVTGGWQSGREWESIPDQTWSATAFLRLVHTGLLGLDARSDGLYPRSAVPGGCGELRLEDYRYREATLDVVSVGEGEVVSVWRDGVEIAGGPLVDATARGHHRLVVRREGAQ